jgi:hypothetical protein
MLGAEAPCGVNTEAPASPEEALEAITPEMIAGVVALERVLGDEISASLRFGIRRRLRQFW